MQYIAVCHNAMVQRLMQCTHVNEGVIHVTRALTFISWQQTGMLPINQKGGIGVSSSQFTN